MAKKFLDDNKIQYVDLDVGKDKEARSEMVKRSGQLGVPVIVVDGELIIGFNQAKLKEKLGIT